MLCCFVLFCFVSCLFLVCFRFLVLCEPFNFCACLVLQGPVEEAQITLPTVAGPIRASFTQSKTRFVLELSPPANTLARVCLPKLGIASNTLTIDGIVKKGVEQGDYVCIEGVGSAAKARIISRGA